MCKIVKSFENMLSTGEFWNSCDLFKTDMPNEFKAKQEERIGIL